MHRISRGHRCAVAVALCGALVVLSVRAAPAGSGAGNRNLSIRLTVEITWNERVANPADESGVEFSLSEGRILGAQSRTPDGLGAIDRPALNPRPKEGTEGPWTLGSRRGGQSRVRIEAPLSAELLVRAGGRLTRFPLPALIDAPQRTLADAPVDVVVQRLRYDAIEIDLEEGEGITTPGAEVPVLLGFNVLSGDPGEIGVQYTAELKSPRTGQVVWRYDARPVAAATDSLERPRQRLMVTAPREPGTYVLEVSANWEPLSSFEASALGRLLKRRKGGPSGSATRRVSLVVLDTGATNAQAKRPAQPIAADRVELNRSHAGRPTTSGRSKAFAETPAPWAVPREALVEPRLRDKLRGWMNRSEENVLSPADENGNAWIAVELHTNHPGRPHRLSLTCAGAAGAAAGVALVVPESGGVRKRVLLDTLASDFLASDSPRTFEWMVWPDQPTPVLLVYNPTTSGPITLHSVELAELAEPAAADDAAAPTARGRSAAVHVGNAHSLDRFGAWVDGSGMIDRLELAWHLRDYSLACGAETLIVPETIADREARRMLDGQADEDSTGADGLELLLRIAEQSRIAIVQEIDCERAFQILPPAGSDEAQRLSLARLDSAGRPQADAYQILRSDVRRALEQHLQRAMAPHARHPNLSGVLIRLGPGSTLVGTPQSGLDDRTYDEFVAAKFPAGEAAKIPGLDNSQADRFTRRVQFTTGAGRSAWLEWRAERLGQVYFELAKTVAREAPGARLVVVTPPLDSGLAAAEARRVDVQGESPDQAWLALGLDLRRWPRDAGGPLVLRGISLSVDSLARDLATSPELDRAVIQYPTRGVWMGTDALPGASNSLALVGGAEPIDPYLGHALAVLDPGWVVVEAAAATGREPALARFNKVYRSLPMPATGMVPAPPLPSGVAVRTFSADGRTYVAIANDTPYEVLQATLVRAPAKTPVDDLGRSARLEPTEAPGGGQSLVLRLPPFGVAAVRISAPDVPVEPGGTYLPAMAAIENQAETLSARLGQAEAFIGPPTADFEPEGRPNRTAAPLVQIAAPGDDPTTTDLVRGWSLAGGAQGRAALDVNDPHEGRGALRFDAGAKAAAVVSDEFLPPAGGTLSLRLWLRSDRDGTQMRLQIEGEAAGKRIIRHADLPVGTEWEERVVRVPNLPADGLDSMRLRFIWLDARPGTIWVDSLSLTGTGTSEPGRRTHRLLMEALQAYRAKRYADFARLIGSRRARQVVHELESDSPQTARTGDASDLPAGRRLR